LPESYEEKEGSIPSPFWSEKEASFGDLSK